MALTVAGWLAIVCGAVVTLLGVMLFCAIFLGGGVPVGGAGLFAVLTVGVGPILTLIGITVMVSGFKLTGGQEWPRTVIQVFSWVVVAASVGWVGYSAMAQRHIHLIDVVHWGIFLLGTMVPGIALILLLRR